MNELRLALLFRVGSGLVGVDALHVQAALLRTDPLISDTAEPELQWDGTSYPIHSASRLLGEAHTPWAAALVLREGAHTVALAVGRCEVVRNVRLYTSLPRALLRSTRSAEVSMFGVEHEAESLGIYLNVRALQRAIREQAA
jgi:hypothetical protein